MMGVDLGSVRIGIALSDSAGRLAFPKGVIARSGDDRLDMTAVAAAGRHVGVTTVVVGLPLALDGVETAAARSARRWAQGLETMVAPARVLLFDERLSTVSAEKALAQAGRSARQRRGSVDSAAATVILQAFLDSKAGAR